MQIGNLSKIILMLSLFFSAFNASAERFNKKDYAIATLFLSSSILAIYHPQKAKAVLNYIPSEGCKLANNVISKYPMLPVIERHFGIFAFSTLMVGFFGLNYCIENIFYVRGPIHYMFIE